MRRGRCGLSNSPGGGFTLVEALVAMAVLGAGVVGVLEMFSLAGSAAGENQRLARAVEIAQRELSLAVASRYAPVEGAEKLHRWRVERQDRPMGLERVAVTVTWMVRGAEQSYVLEQLWLKRKPPAAR